MLTSYPRYKFSVEDAENGLARIEWLDHLDRPQLQELHSHEYNEVIIFTHGGGKHQIDFVEYEINARSIHLVSADSVHLTARNPGSRGFVITYKEQFLYKLQEFNPAVNYIGFFKNSRVIDIDAEAYENFGFLVDEMCRHKNERAYLLTLIGTLFTKMATVFVTDEGQRNTSSEKIIMDLMALINEHYGHHLSITEYAGMLAVSASTLEKKVKREMGCTVAALQQERTLEEAKKLLARPNVSVKEVALQLGFKESSHFANWYKKLTHITPVHFKKGLGAVWLLGMEALPEYTCLGIFV